MSAKIIGIVLAVAVAGVGSAAVVMPHAAKPTHVEAEHKWEGRALAIEQNVLKNDCEQKGAVLNAKGADFWKRMKTKYGIDVEMKDQINFDTGEITWHVEPPSAAAPKAKLAAAAPPTPSSQREATQRADAAQKSVEDAEVQAKAAIEARTKKALPK